MCFTFLQCFNNRELKSFLNLWLRHVTTNTQGNKLLTQGNKTRITSINNRNCEWRRLFWAEQGGKNTKSFSNDKKNNHKLLESMERWIFYPVQRLYSVRRLLSCAETFIQWGDFYPVRRLLSSVRTFIQCGGFYPVRRILSSAETFIQCGEFYPVWRLLSSAETFIRWGDFYPVLRLLSSEKIFI